MAQKKSSSRQKPFKFTKWLISGIGFKRWLILFFISSILLGFNTKLFLDSEQKNFPEYLTLSSILIIISFYSIIRLIFFFEKITNLARRRKLNKYFQILTKDKKSPNIVLIGGGTGLSTLLRGIREYGSPGHQKNISAIITVTDDGGSSGKLREDLNILPPGDIRNCLAALSGEEPLLKKLFQYRFPEKSTMSGHSFGNLYIAALTDITGSFDKAIQESSKILAVYGKILPSTLENVKLSAELDNGKTLIGESKISNKQRTSRKIKKISLLPENAQPLEETIKTINKADVIILGPGSLFTSIIPNLLIKDLRKAVNASNAIKIYVANVMTQPGETEKFSVSDHLETLKTYLGELPDIVIANDSKMPSNLLKRYNSEGAHPVNLDRNRLDKLDIEVYSSDFLYDIDFLRHDPNKLADYLMNLITERLDKK